ncbi:MAG: hypothetical protein HY517_00220 [Candidatus Aenigmarchaeota archaeon]|nr:hypothetical protein [Candidatus Aenigmarchaeota archaeon]
MFTYNGSQITGELELVHQNINPMTGQRNSPGQRANRVRSVSFADDYLEIMKESAYGHPTGGRRVDAKDVNSDRLCRRLGILYEK